VVDCARDDVARSQFFAGVEAGHEALAIGQPEQCAFAAQRFGNQEALGLWVIETGGMELVEFQVACSATCAPRHGDAVAASAVGVAGVQVDLRGTARGQHDEARLKGFDLARVAVEHIGTQATPARQAQLVLGNQIDRDTLLQQFDVVLLPGLAEQGVEDGGASGVGGMDDPPVTMAAFASQVELETAILAVRALVACKGYALLDQPLDRLVAVFDGEAYGVFTAQSAASHQRIGDMGFHGVGGVQDRSNSALSPIGGAIGQVALAQYRNAQVGRKVEREGKAGGTAADDQHVVSKNLVHVHFRGKTNPSI